VPSRVAKNCSRVCCATHCCVTPCNCKVFSSSGESTLPLQKRFERAAWDPMAAFDVSGGTRGKHPGISFRRTHNIWEQTTCHVSRCSSRVRGYKFVPIGIIRFAYNLRTVRLQGVEMFRFFCNQSWYNSRYIETGELSPWCFQSVA
jgi:hypothetical protein